MADYDKAERFAIKRLDPAGFLPWLLVGLDPDLAFASWLETQPAPFPGEPDRRCDCVAEFVSKSGTQPPWACVVEPQGQYQPRFVIRLLQYMLALHEELTHGPHIQDRYPMMAGVVNVCEEPLQVKLSWVPPGASGGKGLTGEVWVRNVYTESAIATLDDIATGTLSRCLLPWVPLMVGGDDPAIITQWKELASQETNAEHRASYGGLAQVFAEKRGRIETWRLALEGWNVQKSAIVEQWRQDGRTEGMKEGRKEGLDQGRDVLRCTVLDVVKAKINDQIPDDVRHAVAAEQDFATLSRWVVLASTADTIDAFRAAIQTPKTNGHG